MIVVATIVNNLRDNVICHMIMAYHIYSVHNMQIYTNGSGIINIVFHAVGATEEPCYDHVELSHVFSASAYGALIFMHCVCVWFMHAYSECVSA